jgi:hypothetical protein
MERGGVATFEEGEGGGDPVKDAGSHTFHVVRRGSEVDGCHLWFGKRERKG